MPFDFTSPKLGDLRHRIAIQSATYTRAAGGQKVASWSTDATVWAKVEDMSGNERLQSDQVKAAGLVKITIRFREGTTSKNRVVYGSRTLDVNSVSDPEGTRRWMVLLCGEAK